MTIAHSFFARRRLWLVAILTLLLHLLTIDWLATHVGDRASRSSRAAETPVMLAQLHLDVPKPAPKPEPLPEPKPVPPLPKPVHHRSPPPEIAPLPPAEPAPTDEAALAAPVMPVEQAAGSAPASGAPAAPAVQSAAAPAASTPPVAAAPPQQPPFGNVRRFKVDVPPPARFMYDVKRVDADGTKWNGEAAMRWEHDAASYKVNLEIGISVLVTRINLLVLTSAGSIDDYGLAPDLSTEKRKGRALTNTHFNRGDQPGISFSASDKTYPLLPGAQDKASVPFQLAGIGRANVNQFTGDIDILVGEDKSADIYRFELVGQDELDTKMGKLVTWHLSRPPRPGTYNSQLDIWLAPSLGWYPVQIRNSEASGALTTQTATSITPL